MFDEQRYQRTDEFKDIGDLQEWMKYQGHLWFFINEKYYFMTGSHEKKENGVLAPCWHIYQGDYLNPDLSEEELSKIIWRFWSLEEVWRARVFDGSSFSENFCNFIFFS